MQTVLDCRMHAWVAGMDILCSPTLARGHHIFLPATSASSLAGSRSLSRAGVRLGAAELHTLSISSEKLHRLPQVVAFFFLVELQRDSSKTRGLKVPPEVRSLPAECLASWGWAMQWVGQRVETEPKSLSSNGPLSSSPHLCMCSLFLTCSLCTRSKYLSWEQLLSHLSPEERLISTHSMRSV